MLKQKIFQIAVIFAAFMIFNLTAHSGEPCNKSSDVDNGVGTATGAYGHAEVVYVGWWESDNRHYAGVTLWGYVENLMGPGKIVASIKYDFWVVELTQNFNFKDAWYTPPAHLIVKQLDLCESLIPSSHTDSTSFRAGKWLDNRIARAETRVTVQATTGERGASADEWVATGCVDIVFE